MADSPPPKFNGNINPQIQEVQWILNEHRKYDENYTEAMIIV